MQVQAVSVSSSSSCLFWDFSALITIQDGKAQQGC